MDFNHNNLNLVKKKFPSNFISKLNKNISLFSFLLTFALCGLILYFTSIFELKDYSTTIGLSSDNFDYKLFSDGQTHSMFNHS